MISVSMRNVLIEHMDGRAVPIVRNFKIAGIKACDANFKSMAVRSLLEHKLLKHDHSHSPTHTLITNAGREALGKVLGEMAEILIRAGLRVEELAEVARTSGGSLVNPAKVSESQET